MKFSRFLSNKIVLTVCCSLGLVAVFPISSTQADITTGLENHYDFNDDASIDIDSSGNGQDAMTVTGVTWIDDPERGGVIELVPGDAGFVHAPMVDLNDTGGEFTIAAWIFRSGETHTAGNDGIFTVQQPGTTNAGHPKIIGAWIGGTNFAPDGSVWGRVVPPGGPNISLARDGAIVPNDEWVHLAYRGTDLGDGSFLFDTVFNGDSFAGPSLTYDGVLTPHDNIFIGRQGTESWGGRLDDFRIYSRSLTDEEIQQVMIGVPPEPFVIDGSGETYSQNFDDMGTGRRMPEGWSGEDADGSGRRIDSLGLIEGPLEGAVASAAGIVNVGGSAEHFTTSDPSRLATWKADLDGSGILDEGDIETDANTDRALGNARVEAGDPGSISFEITIDSKPLRAFVADWDLEVWGGDPEAAFRGPEGAGYATDLQVGGISYYSETVSVLPGDLFDSSFDLAPGVSVDPTLIDGNEHSVRGNTSGIVEVSAADGAVGNLVNWTFDGNHGGDDGGWIQAVDNVQFRALAAGDAQADGDVDPADLIQLLAGGAFGQGNIDATWGQGDFDNDGDFDGTDILAVVQGLAGEFPKTYAHDPSNGVPDVLINPATGNITLDTNGTTIGSIVMDSAAGIFNGPNSPSWDAPGDFAADIDTQISMPISFTNPGYTGVDDLGDGIIGDLVPGFDILADLTIKYLDPNGDLLDAEAHVVPEPSSIVLATFGLLGMLGYLWRRRSAP